MERITSPAGYELLEWRRSDGSGQRTHDPVAGVLLKCNRKESAVERRRTTALTSWGTVPAAAVSSISCTSRRLARSVCNSSRSAGLSSSGDGVTYDVMPGRRVISRNSLVVKAAWKALRRAATATWRMLLDCSACSACSAMSVFSKSGVPARSTLAQSSATLPAPITYSEQLELVRFAPRDMIMKPYNSRWTVQLNLRHRKERVSVVPSDEFASGVNSS